MEEYTNSSNPNPRPNFLYSSASGNHQNQHQQHHDHHHQHHHNQLMNTFHLQSGGGSDHSFQPAVKTEANTSQLHTPIFHYPLMRGNLHQSTMHNHQGGGGSNSSSSEAEAIKAKIIAHPQYSSLLEAYMDCQKVINQLFILHHIQLIN